MKDPNGYMMLNAENDFILFDRIEVIKKTIEKYGEENFYISFSGGKDKSKLL